MAFNKTDYQRVYMRQRRIAERARLDELRAQVGQLITENMRLRKEIETIRARVNVATTPAVTVAVTQESPIKEMLCQECLKCTLYKIGMCKGRVSFDNCTRYFE